LKITKIASPNFGERRNNIKPDMLVLHYTGMPTAKDALDKMTSEAGATSAHYMIYENGDIIQLVDEDKRAWHAGVSYWRGAEDINSHSIGIEIVNKGHDWGYEKFSEEQMASVIELSKDIISRNNIAPHNIVAHSDIAPTRKQDPGELFNWQLLAKNGIGMWIKDNVNIAQSSNADIVKILSDIGYKTGSETENEAAIIAFRRRYCPHQLGNHDLYHCYETNIAALSILSQIK